MAIMYVVKASGEVMMRVSREQMAQSRRTILEAAGRLFRERGFEAVTVAEIMNAAGLTHGGFYGYFRSKDELLAEALGEALTRTTSGPLADLATYAASYLSRAHRDDLAGGCPTAALAAETIRQAGGVRAEMTTGLNSRLNASATSPQAELALKNAARRSAVVEAVPLLGALLSIPTGNRYPPLNLTPQKRKERTIHAQVAQVEGLAARQPVLMVFEDVHWSDPTTREQLDLLIERVASLRVLLIITFRPEFTPPWIGRPHVTLLTLSRLPPRQRAEMITHMIRGKALPKEIADQIINRTDGVPLFIEELTKTVLESGIVTEAGDRYSVTGPVPSLAIPTSLHASLLARLDRLAPTREIAQVGAALGRNFSHELISAVAGIPQRQVDDALTQLVAAELIFRRGVPPDAEYTFKHALVQDAAYDTLLKSRRQQLHGRIATTLERQFPEVGEGQPEVVARHCAEAGLLEKAVDYFLTAGRQAIARWAMTEAAAQLRKGLGLLPGLPDGPARHERELNLQIDLGHALATIKGYSADEPGEAYARARELCEQLGGPPQLGPVLWGQFVYRFVRAELDQAEVLAADLRTQGQIRNDPRWMHAGWHASGVVCSVTGRFIDACTYCENDISIWDPEFRAWVPSPEDPYVSIRLYYYRALFCLGRIDEARMRVDEALTEARRLSAFQRGLCPVSSISGPMGNRRGRGGRHNPRLGG